MKAIPGNQSTAFWGAMAKSAKVGEAMSVVSHNHNKRDANERVLLDVAIQMGAVWFEFGPFDGWIWLSRRQLYRPVEIKLPEREGTFNEYTPLQKRTKARMDMVGAPLWTWRTSADVVRDLNS